MATRPSTVEPFTIAPNATAADWIQFPLRTVSALNTREHWAARMRRVRLEREVTAAALMAAYVKPLRDDETAHVTLYRIAPRMLDGHDNLCSALKGVADELTKRLGLTSDSDPRLRWSYGQRKGKPREYAVGVVVERGRVAG